MLEYWDDVLRYQDTISVVCSLTLTMRKRDASACNQVMVAYEGSSSFPAELLALYYFARPCNNALSKAVSTNCRNKYTTASCNIVQVQHQTTRWASPLLPLSQTAIPVAGLFGSRCRYATRFSASWSTRTRWYWPRPCGWCGTCATRAPRRSLAPCRSTPDPYEICRASRARRTRSKATPPTRRCAPPRTRPSRCCFSSSPSSPPALEGEGRGKGGASRCAYTRGWWLR